LQGETKAQSNGDATKSLDHILEQCFADMGVEKTDTINFTTFSDAMNLHGDRTGKKYTATRLKAMFDEADWYGTGEFAISELIEVCRRSLLSALLLSIFTHTSIECGR
jgi:Ca2+-binding EF-hand superfamily protein